MTNITKKIDAAEIGESIQFLNEYVKEAGIEPVIVALEALEKAPDNSSLLVQLEESLDNIGVLKGAVLTYAPYISFLVSSGLYDDD